MAEVWARVSVHWSESKAEVGKNCVFSFCAPVDHFVYLSAAACALPCFTEYCFELNVSVGFTYSVLITQMN